MTISSRFTLRTILTTDAVTALAMGLLLTVLPETLAALTALPASLLFYSGLVLLPLGVLMFAIGRFGHGHAGAVWLVILGNEAWVVASFALLLTGWVAPNALGVAFVVAQALVVALFAALEYASLRAAPRPASVQA
ncbi:MAG: hypothetical protein RLO50_13305 [Azospirillaceae bacterium]